MMTTLIILGILTAGLIIYRIALMAKIKNAPMVSDHEKILTLTAQNFNHQTKNRLVLVDFWASWCAPCRMMAPVLNDVASALNDDAYVGKVDIQTHQTLASKFKVRNIPTLILFKNGKEHKRYVGIKSKDFLLKEITKSKSN
jgi:thioredoxin 1